MPRGQWNAPGIIPSRSSSRTSRRSTKTASPLACRARASSRLIVVIRAFASSTICRNPFLSFVTGCLPGRVVSVSAWYTVRPAGGRRSGSRAGGQGEEDEDQGEERGALAAVLERPHAAREVRDAGTEEQETGPDPQNEVRGLGELQTCSRARRRLGHGRTIDGSRSGHGAWPQQSLCRWMPTPG